LLGNPKNPRAISKLEEFSGEMYREALLNSPTTGISLKVKNLFDSKEEFDALKRLIHGLTDSELYQKIKEISDTLDTKILPITVSVDIDYWLPRLQAVISATSQGGSFIDPQSVSKGAVICDASQPPDINVSTEEFSQDDVTIYEGGIIDLPSETTRFGYQNVLGLPQGKTFSCFGETIVLTMSQYGKNASIGRKVSLEEAQHIYDLALSHGFKPSVPNDNRTKESNPQQTKELLSDKILESVI
jgi:predicted amino acid dehydrogenase